MSELWRCFVGVALDLGLRTALADAVTGWRTDPRTDQLRWVPPEALHLTLGFLGSIEPDQVQEVRALTAGVARRHGSMTRTTGRLGAFARPGSARVLWYAIADEDGGLSALAGDLAGALQLPWHEPYRPHITLAHARRRSVDLRGWIEAASASAPDGTLAINGLDLMRSHLGTGPARYETLASFPLGGVSGD
jgi:RNA 2',3'-cyclic 3'-phosphodiesterase